MCLFTLVVGLYLFRHSSLLLQVAPAESAKDYKVFFFDSIILLLPSVCWDPAWVHGDLVSGPRVMKQSGGHPVFNPKGCHQCTMGKCCFCDGRNHSLYSGLGRVCFLVSVVVCYIFNNPELSTLTHSAWVSLIEAKSHSLTLSSSNLTQYLVCTYKLSFCPLYKNARNDLLWSQRQI